MSRTDCKHLGIITGERFPDCVKKGVGDHFANVLDRFGLTKEKWAALTSSYISGCGGCNKRHDLMNWAASKLGFDAGTTTEFRKAMQSNTLVAQYVFSCSIKNKCLPRGKVAGELLQVITNNGLHPCENCEAYSSKN